ncbi:unnamed protein product [Rotaria socialis]|uniref:Endonuclease/exonuclease/phosphatase domain-containing protein n=1 Tax=Rotaria socialis TaxID=392032 RepID=A0A821HLB9_9BILA|nr:unnamed protein product [Rotaria socialis]CAF4687647.1 unnamed protein product [Rotaria socialis]
MIENTNKSNSQIVRVCTFNLRRGDLDTGTPNEWDKRRPIAKTCIEHIQPTLIATQEGYPAQLKDVLDDLNESSKSWSWVGEEIEDWHTINAIFYRHDLFSLVATKTFWFNDHPLTIGAAWGAKHSRGCTCAHFEHLTTKASFIIYNAHLDFPSQQARCHSIPILLSQIKENNDHIDNVIVTGNFNNWPEEVEGETPADELTLLGQKASEIEQMKEAGFVDTDQYGVTSTYNGFRKAGYGPKIDFIWISSNSVYRVEGETKVDDYHDENGFFPSDHFPVYADLVYAA